jgi:hypothetical protein
MAETQDTVRRRVVFYIPGFDPFHPRRYRELYRKEGAEQASVSGYHLTLRPRKAAGPYGWRVEAEIDGAAVTTEVEVLVWSDIVKDSMAQGIAATYLQLLRTAWVYIATGTLFRLMRLRKGPILAALYPVAMLLAQAGVAGLAGWGVAVALMAAVPGWAAAAAGVTLAVLVLRLFKRHDNRLYAYYLMHDFAFTARDRGAYPEELEARLAAFRRRIAAALAGEADEVLVVGHSSGAHLAVSVLADLIRGGLPDSRPALGLLTLGHAVPMAAFLPDAHRLRADLHLLAGTDTLAWVDVSAPGDGCSFALCDPVSVTGVAPPGKRWPLVISAAFTRTLSPERWRALRRRYFRLHFQYLCAFDRPGDYDYFRVTAGPLTLRDRFAGRAPSKSRIETPASGHVTMAA